MVWPNVSGSRLEALGHAEGRTACGLASSLGRGAPHTPQYDRRVALSKNNKVGLLKRTALFAECTNAELIEIALNSDECPVRDRLRCACVRESP
jgi:hypothetical protein